jgi:hypothetical protein
MDQPVRHLPPHRVHRLHLLFHHLDEVLPGEQINQPAHQDDQIGQFFANWATFEGSL